MQGCIFTFLNGYKDDNKQTIVLKPIISSFDNTIILYHVNFITKWGCYDKLFSNYKNARQFITKLSKDW